MLADELRSLIENLRDADPQDDQAFPRMIGDAMTVLRLVDKDLSEEFGASRTTITRWRNGTNAPHAAMRRPVYAFLEERAKSLLKSEQSRAATSSRPPVGYAIAARSR